MAHLMRHYDWENTPLGHPRRWPDGLKVPLKMLLTSRFEMWLGWGPDLLFFYNDSYIPTLGMKHPSMLARPFREVWAEVYDEVADQVAQVRSGEATWNDALLLLLERSGYPEETYHSFSYSPLYGNDGDVQGLLCVVSEVTERVVSERRLEMLRILGMKLVGASDHATVRNAALSALDGNRWDVPFALLYLHSEAPGCTAGANHLLSRNWPHHDDTAPDTVRQITLPQGMDYPCGPWKCPPAEALIVSIPGLAGEASLGSLVLGLNPHRRDDPKVADIARIVAGQISGALANVDALQSERRRANRIWSHARDLMVVVSADGILQSVSPAWPQILGHPEDSVVGRHFRDFILPEDMPITVSAFKDALGKADLTAFENRLRTRDGGYRWISWHTAMEDGMVYGYGRDITEQKASAETLAATEEALRHAQKMEAVGQLTGGIAHDFNNLLTGIIGSLDMMRRRLTQNRLVDAERYATAATGSANRAASLTQRLLAFSRRQPLDPKTVDVNELVRSMGELIRRSIGETIEFELATAPGIWRIRCDPNQLESTVLNLAINARDAMPGGGRLVIKTGNVRRAAPVAPGQPLREQTADEQDFVTIVVIDTGCGMAPDVVARAFEPFFTTKPIGQGTGLGLSMIYGFAQQSGGFVEIDSTVGQGTTVRLCLPRCEAGPSQSAAAEPGPVVLRGRCESILVVEDEDNVRTLVVEALQDLGYRTIEAADVAAGLDHLQSGANIDLLLTDVVLPGGLNGGELAVLGRSVRPELKVLFMTGYTQNAAVSYDRLESGMEMITKPFTIERLAQKVQSIIAGPAEMSGSTPSPGQEDAVGM
jgi:PAS domain S-box-containing protein